MGVIFGYFLPLYLALVVLLMSNGVMPNVVWLYGGLFFAIFSIFSTLSFPIAVIYWRVFSEGYTLTLWSTTVLLTLYALTTLFIPAGFLQVSKTGSYWSAFNVPAAMALIVKNFREYCRAWGHSVVMSLVGHFAIPFSAWGVFWCYLGIIFAFNSILKRGDGRVNSWFDKLASEEELMMTPTSNPHILQCLHSTEDPERTLVFKLGPIFVPIPRLVLQRISA